jgi:glyoxylase-like metal-dependent hydrolase (beta-lactamase superfamily II)
MSTIAPKRVAPEIGWLPVSFVNVYFVGRPGDRWVLVDAGLPGRRSQIAAAAEARYGTGARPEAIILTHGHFDHAGSAPALAELWDVPVYAHPLEIPYLTRNSPYPPQDPTLGGAIAFASRFMPRHAPDLSGVVRPLTNEAVPGVEGWRWLFTPGHAPGHISLFHDETRTLIAGDAFATMNMDSFIGFVTKRPEISIAGAPFHYDWGASHASVEKLAELRPRYVAAGHGRPMINAIRKLERFARSYKARPGRYAVEAARTNEEGFVWAPPAPFDVLPPLLVIAGIGGLGAALLLNCQQTSENGGEAGKE